MNCVGKEVHMYVKKMVRCGRVCVCVCMRVCVRERRIWQRFCPAATHLLLLRPDIQSAHIHLQHRHTHTHTHTHAHTSGTIWRVIISLLSMSLLHVAVDGVMSVCEHRADLECDLRSVFANGLLQCLCVKAGGVIYIDGCLLWDIKGRVCLYCPCACCTGEMIRIEPLVQ